jgi:hypothetical protein
MLWHNQAAGRYCQFMEAWAAAPPSKADLVRTQAHVRYGTDPLGDISDPTTTERLKQRTPVSRNSTVPGCRLLTVAV